MQLLLSFVIGAAVGILMTVPLGPTSIYVAQRTLNNETRKGMHVAMGSVIIDILYCLVISLGLISLVSQYIQNEYVQLGFSIFLILYGARMLFFDGKKAAPAPERLPSQSKRFMEKRGPLNVLLGTVMALSNPTLFISWTAVIGFLSANGLLPGHFFDKVIFSFATGFGSLLWFLGLALFVRSRRHTLSPGFVRKAGAVTAMVVIVFGIYFSVTVITHFGRSVNSLPGGALML